MCGDEAALLLVLAVAVDPAWAEDPGQRDMVRVRERSKEEPWLRIDSGGHTAAVRALAFTSDSCDCARAGWTRTLKSGISRHCVIYVVSFFASERIRWQVRGLRGCIYALAARKGGQSHFRRPHKHAWSWSVVGGNRDSPELLAIGGYGAMGSLGEICWSTRSTEA